MIKHRSAKVKILTAYFIGYVLIGVDSFSQITKDNNDASSMYG
jgi:hypothetical protein